MKPIDRRTFLGYGCSAAALALLPLAGCGGGDDFAPVSLAGQGPVAEATNGLQFQTLAQAHSLVVTDERGDKKSYGGVGLGPGQLNYPTGVAVLNGLVYVVETGNHRVQVFDEQGNTQGMIGVGELLYPSAIAAGKDEIFVADARHSRIVAFAPDGRVNRVLGVGALSAPRGMDVSDDGILVADPGLRKVLLLGLDGKVNMEVGTDWVLPWDVATDKHYIYVADVSKDEVGVVTMTGAPAGRITLGAVPSNVWLTQGRLAFAVNT